VCSPHKSHLALILSKCCWLLIELTASPLLCSCFCSNIHIYTYIHYNSSPPAVSLPELQALLTAPAFLRSFFRALALNHRKAATEGGGSSGGEQWSLGVQEVLADSIREGKTVFPSTRLGLMRYTHTAFMNNYVRSYRLL
jgi:hypothetical protein